MANNNNIVPVSEDDMRALEDLLSEMKERAGKAHEQGNVILLSLYAELVKLVSPEVQRLRARLDREEKAHINRLHKELRASRRTSA